MYTWSFSSSGIAQALLINCLLIQTLYNLHSYEVSCFSLKLFLPPVTTSVPYLLLAQLGPPIMIRLPL